LKLAGCRLKSSERGAVKEKEERKDKAGEPKHIRNRVDK
jgi:hypothetical protein